MSRPPRSSLFALATALVSVGAGFAHADTTVYLDVAGTTIKPGVGVDDPTKQYSSLVTTATDIPAWSVAQADLDGLVACLGTEFAPFPVSFTTTRPTGALYYEVVIGGGPALVGAAADAVAAGPASCAAVPRSLVFVFPDAVGGDPARVCQAVAYAIGLANGLDAASDPRDLMSPTAGARKSFVDESIMCGATSAAPCRCGGDTQNSYQILATALGLRGAGGGADAGVGGDPGGGGGGGGGGDPGGGGPSSVGLVGGCNSGGGASSGALAGLLGLALFILRRRL